MSRGNILRGAAVKDPPPGDEAASAADENTRVISKVFTVTPDMSPVTRVMVYYIRDDGEVVADSIAIKVAPSFENNVSIFKYWWFLLYVI